MWQHVHLSEQVCPCNTLACCWDINYANNRQQQFLCAHQYFNLFAASDNITMLKKTGRACGQIARTFFRWTTRLLRTKDISDASHPHSPTPFLPIPNPLSLCLSVCLSDKEGDDKQKYGNCICKPSIILNI